MTLRTLLASATLALSAAARAEAPVYDTMPEEILSTQGKLDAENAREEARVAALRKKCGKDFQRIKIGMSWKRVRECSNVQDFSLRYEDARAKVFDSEGGSVRVENGKITRLLIY